jgi:chromosome segregation ATPase
MKVLVSVASGTLWQSAAPQFTLASVADCAALPNAQSKPVLVSNTVTTDEIAVLLQQYPDIDLVVAYESAEILLARLLDEAMPFDKALSFWQKNTGALLKLQQQHRRHLKLFNLNALSENTAALPDWLSAVYKKSNNTEAHTILSVIAAQALRQNTQLNALYQRLFASSLPLTEQMEPVFDLELIQQKLGQNDELENTRSERDLVLMQLQHVQEELEQLFHKKTEVKQLYESLQDDYQRDASLLQNKIKDGETKVSSTTRQLALLQAELERLTAAHNAAHSELKQTSDERDSLLQQIQQLNKTTEQTKNKQKQTEEENQLLLLQFQQVQEELEHYYLKLQTEQQKNNHASTAKDKQQQRELSKLESQLRRTKAKAASAEHNTYLLQQELKAVKGSVLWKSGAPVRVLGRIVNKVDKAKQKLQQETALILTSEYFDLEWYLETYPDVAQSNINPAEHYLKFGAAEGRMPGPLFDGNWYLQRYPDVASVNINPLLHFVKFGQQEGRSASPKLLTDNSQPKEE